MAKVQRTLGETSPLPHELDAIDVALLDALQHDARASLTELGGKVGLSAPSVLERVRKLEQARVITGYHAHLDAIRLGLDVAAFIGVRVGDARKVEPVERALHGIDEVQECHHVTGAYTLLLKAKVKNTRALEALIGRLRALDGVTSTDTMVVLSTHLERCHVALAAPETARRRGRPRRNGEAR